ncbi:MAG: tRNA epoxyqueuosine(34) reductase QueG [Sedimentisphaerales bacterium]|nr:tRNA epoxyqueuosine(34) reductase QueG [Sedimentisphaerales bacterium]
MSLTDEIKSKALELGFDLVGVTGAGRIDSEQVEIFQSWLESGCAGQMSYMHNNLDKRINPSQLVENAQSIIITGLNYNPPEKMRFCRTPQTPVGKIASYACYEDYHTFIKKQLHKLADFISSQTDRGIHSKICVDSVPLAERALAVRAGLGFIGKNHMFINPDLGCKIFLGEIITDLKLEFDQPISTGRVRCIALKESYCSSCNKCIKVCPTGALRQDGFFDAGRCINYLTIEYKGEISTELAGKIGNRLFGCEECIKVCPYQKNAPVCKNKQFKFYPERAQINLEDVLNLSEELFEEKFRDSVIKRSGLDVLKRNARICLANRTFL